MPVTPEIFLVLVVLAATVILFVTDKLRVDIISIIIMLTLGWLGLVSPAQTFSGFASNAVISVMAVMILGYGVDRTGVMMRLARTIVRVAGASERKLITVIYSVVGILSGFMQNIGSAALFLPAVLRISKKTDIPRSRLIMPMGFMAILGGTITMVGSSPLILLNDLLIQGGLEPFGIFAVTPIGLALLMSGILYFLLLGRYVLPSGEAEAVVPVQQEIIETWQLPRNMHHYIVPKESQLVGMSREDVSLKARYSLHLLAVKTGRDILYAPWRYFVFAEGQILSLLGTAEDAERFGTEYGLVPVGNQQRMSEEVGEEHAGFAEIIVRPHSPYMGKTLKEVSFRKEHGLEVIISLTKEGEHRREFFDLPMEIGDTFVVYGSWEKINRIGQGPEFVLSTVPEEKGVESGKGPLALVCLVGGIGLTFTGVPIALGLLTGAIAMILGRVLSIGEAYRAIDWRTVFLLAGLIPLGIAMDQTGTAAYIADAMMSVLSMAHPFLILLGIAALATFFSLFMSNVAATVLLVPLVIIIGTSADLDPRGLALLVAICASNSFILPTHQVNAFLMTPGGYRNGDYLRAGAGMTLLFLVLASGLVYILFVL
ncbi:citrate transporter [Methanomicrobiaceae archaeon CYW5]|uniref:SLC13 family permease n=1 Tax=Methanovulcanius yangii TaxID=1789227 RepID=UPI0029C9C16B|nr:SLC13 family permease [Methanovulcanius yangii]MBT8506866.1 citrate transporter [Methanovulcanius yangii]